MTWYLLVAVFSVRFCAEVFFGFVLPQASVPGVGRVYQLNEHGTVVYLTYWEHLIVGPFSSAVILVLLLVWLILHRLPDGTWDVSE